MNPAVRSDLLESMGLVGRGLGILQARRFGPAGARRWRRWRCVWPCCARGCRREAPAAAAGRGALFVEDFEEFVSQLAVR
jgi:hypothetical protein